MPPCRHDFRRIRASRKRVSAPEGSGKVLTAAYGGANASHPATPVADPIAQAADKPHRASNLVDVAAQPASPRHPHAFTANSPPFTRPENSQRSPAHAHPEPTR